MAGRSSPRVPPRARPICYGLDATDSRIHNFARFASAERENLLASRMVTFTPRLLLSGGRLPFPRSALPFRSDGHSGPEEAEVAMGGADSAGRQRLHQEDEERQVPAADLRQGARQTAGTGLVRDAGGGGGEAGSSQRQDDGQRAGVREIHAEERWQAAPDGDAWNGELSSP